MMVSIGVSQGDKIYMIPEAFLQRAGISIFFTIKSVRKLSIIELYKINYRRHLND